MCRVYKKILYRKYIIRSKFYINLKNDSIYINKKKLVLYKKKIMSSVNITCDDGLGFEESGPSWLAKKIGVGLPAPLVYESDHIIYVNKLRSEVAKKSKSNKKIKE